jgi:tRNA(adenine34) deaminase
MDDERYMLAALGEARMALEDGEVPIGCIITGGDKIIARGHNLTQTLNDPTAHAEMQAITAATAYLGGKYLDRCTLYVTVEPCPMCAAALNWAQIGKIVYGCKDPKRGYSLFKPSLLHPKTEVVSGILDGECEKLMKEVFCKKKSEKNCREEKRKTIKF